jgi:hypothetical protein
MADYRFVRGLRLRGPDDKDFLRSAAVPVEPSLRARATAAMQTRDASQQSVHRLVLRRKNDSEQWYSQFAAVAKAVERHMEGLGLSVFDREYLHQHLIAGAPLGKLPILEYVAEQLERLESLSQQIRATALRRHKAVDRLKKTCAGGNSPSYRRGDAVCGPAQHEKVAQTIRDVDAMTVEIMRLVSEWRTHLQVPLPFHVDGENVLFRLAGDYAIGSAVSLACGHLRNTSRYSAFFYASPFDAVAAGSVAPSAKPALAQWDALVGRELAVQRVLVRDQLSFARMGLFHCVLRVPRSMLAVAGMKPGCVLHITDRRRKQELVSCLGTAYRHLLRRRQQTTGKASHLAGLATFSPKALHLQYLRKWIEWVALRREKREAAAGFLQESILMLLRARWNDWTNRVDLERERASKWKPFLARTERHMLRLYTQKWFMHHAFGTISRQVRRVLFLRYFHGLHHLVMRRRLVRDFSSEARTEDGDVAYPVGLASLRAVAGLASAAAIPALSAVAQVGRRDVLQRRRLESDERRERRLELLMAEQKERTVISCDILLQAFAARATSLLRVV